MNKLLVTGFSGAANAAVNASSVMLDGLEAASPDPDWQVDTAVLPLSWQRAPAQLFAVIDEDVRGVLCLGEQSRPGFALERIARNHSGGAADGDGVPGPEGVIVTGAHERLRSRLPLPRLERALGAAGMPVVCSDQAGGGLCNHVFYLLMHHVVHARGDLVAGLIHVPRVDLAGVDENARAARVLVAELIEHLTIRGAAFGVAFGA